MITVRSVAKTRAAHGNTCQKPFVKTATTVRSSPSARESSIILSTACCSLHTIQSFRNHRPNDIVRELAIYRSRDRGESWENDSAGAAELVQAGRA